MKPEELREYAALHICAFRVEQQEGHPCYVTDNDLIECDDWHPDTNRDQLHLIAMKIDTALIDAIDSGEYEFWNLCMTDPLLALQAICEAHKEANP